jgi:hypothetical protein
MQSVPTSSPGSLIDLSLQAAAQIDPAIFLRQWNKLLELLPKFTQYDPHDCSFDYYITSECECNSIRDKRQWGHLRNLFDFTRLPDNWWQNTIHSYEDEFDPDRKNRPYDLRVLAYHNIK